MTNEDRADLMADEYCGAHHDALEHRSEQLRWSVYCDGVLAGLTASTAYPNIGPDPMKGDRSNRFEQAVARVREAYVKQQACVPNQTALVWRWDIGALISEITRLTALAGREGVDRGMVEREELAKILNEDPQARRIALEDDAPAFEDSKPEVQAYWLAIADAVAAALSRKGG